MPEEKLEAELQVEPKKPQDDGRKSRKWLTAVVGCGAAWAVMSLFMAAAMTFPGVLAAAKQLGLDAPLYVASTKWLVGFAVIGYGATNVAEKFVLTR